MNTRTIFHRDGTVTYWNVFIQQWVKRADPRLVAPDVYASLSMQEAYRWQLAAGRRAKLAPSHIIPAWPAI